jgi:hypothetical protein
VYLEELAIAAFVSLVDKLKGIGVPAPSGD